MHPIIATAGYLLEAILLWRLLAWRAWRYFPVFFSYLAFLLARQAVLGYVESRYGSGSVFYSRWFWYTASPLDVVKLLVAWEVFRKVFPAGSAARSFASVLLVTILAGLTVFYAFGGVHETFFFLAVGINFSFAVALWIFGVLVLAQYYRIALGWNEWGIAIGLGLFSATAVVNYSTLGLDLLSFPVFAYVRPASFVLSVLIWTWCLWSYRPASDVRPPADSPPAVGPGEPLKAAGEAVGRAMKLRKP